MSKPGGARRRPPPQRTCVGCRAVLAKRELVRIVRTPEGLRIDPTGKAEGRGAYLHEQRSCWERALAGPLAQALRTELTEADHALLAAWMDRLPPLAGSGPQLTDGATQPRRAATRKAEGHSR